MRGRIHDYAMTGLGLAFLGMSCAKGRLNGYTSPNRVAAADLEGRIDYLQDIFGSLRRFFPADFDVRGKDVLEMSPGSSRGIGVLLIAMGARSYQAIDAFDLAGAEDHSFYERLLSRVDGGSPDDRREALAATGDPRRFAYAVGRDFDIARMAGSRRFDLMLSCAAFEHYDDPGEVVASMSKVARPGCAAVHIIDMQTHSRWIRDHDPNNIYRFPERVYRAFGFPGQPNRWRPRDFVGAFEANGWCDVRFLPIRRVEDERRSGSLRGLAAPFGEPAMDMDVLDGVLTASRPA